MNHIIRNARRKITADACQKEVRFLQTFFPKVPSQTEGERNWKMIEALYTELNIIDKKLVHLLAFNGGMLVANGLMFREVIDFVLAHPGEAGTPYKLVVALLMVSSSAALLSALFSAAPGIAWISSLAIASQDWAGEAPAAGPDPPPSGSAVGEMALKRLVRVKQTRTRYYYRSVLLSCAAAGLTIGALIATTLLVFLVPLEQ